MRIGIDARLVYYHNAGIGQYITRLVSALAEVDHEDEFLIFQSWRERTRLVNASNFKRRWFVTPSHNRFETTFLSVESFPHRLDVLHSPDFIPPSRLAFPSVITVHDLAFLLYPRFLTPKSARYYGQVDRAAQRANQIIAVSQSTKRDIVKLLGVPEEKVTVIYEAAHPLFQPMDRALARRHVANQFGVQGDFILFVSTIEPRKNLPTLLQALRHLIDRNKLDTQLVVAGQEGWLTEEVHATVDKLNLQRNVRFVGGVPNEELHYLYNAACVFAQPSFYEGFGLTPLEAMACGTPVVVSNTSSLPEVVGDAGVLEDPNNAEAWAVALWRVLSNPDLQLELCEKGRRRAALFSWDRAARETLAVYRKAAGK